MKKKILFLIPFLLLGIIAGAQEHFYYYKGAKVPLTLNTQRVNFRVTGEFDSINITNLGYKLSNFHEDNLVKNTFFGEIDFNSSDYTTCMENLKEIDGIIGIFPHFQKNKDKSIGTSDVFYVKLKNIEDFNVLQQTVVNKGGKIEMQVPYMPEWYIISVDDQDLGTAVHLSNEFYETGLFADIDPAFMFNFTPACSNDPMFGSLWGLDNTINQGIDINVCPAWDITQGNGIKVAVLDTGIDLIHNDLQANISNISYDCETQTSPSVLASPFSYNHGTHVGGIIGAVKDNNLQGVGVAPQSELISISHSFTNFPTLSGHLAIGMSWAYQNGADVINNSWGDNDTLGYNFGSALLENAITNAITSGRNGKGTVVVFATGNEDRYLRYPAIKMPDILAVGAINSTGNRWVNSSLGSNYGTLLDVVAPGGNIISTIPNNGISSLSGTSQAAPHAAGVAALVLSVNPDLTGQEVRDIIERTAKKVNDTLYNYVPTTGRLNGDWNDEMGYGLVNAYDAVMEAGILDLYMRNSNDDTGEEPDTVSPYFHDSPDVWIRNNDDNIENHENAEYNPSTPNYVYVKVHNRGTIPSTVNDSLEVYWAKGSTSLQWDDHWNGSIFIGGVVMGDKIGKKPIPILHPGDSIIVKFEWYPPHPDEYLGINSEPWHFCLAARIDSERDPMTFPETSEFAENVQNNNNIAWKNLTVVDVQPNKPIGGVIYAGNPYNYPKAYRFKLYTETLIYEEAEVKLTLDPIIYNAWIAGGGIGTGIIITEEPNVVRVVASTAMLENVMFDPNEYGTVNLTFNFLTEEYTGTPEYKYHLEQRHMGDNSLLGGEAYLINTYPRDLFCADAGGNREVNYAESVVLSATDIGEDAVYKWYDNDDNLVHQGKNYIVTVYDETVYKLEVTATADGYKDYDNVAVSLRPNSIDKIYPNPSASSMVQVDYTINHGNNAYVRIAPVYGASGNGTNYPVNINENEIQIDISGYAAGAYKVILYCDGTIVASENLLIN